MVENNMEPSQLEKPLLKTAAKADRLSADCHPSGTLSKAGITLVPDSIDKPENSKTSQPSKEIPPPKPKPSADFLKSVNDIFGDISSDSDDEDDDVAIKPSLQIDTRNARDVDDIKAVCIIDDDPYWLVEQIKDVKIDSDGHRHYLVKWVGYPESANSWEPEENCSMCGRLVEEFLRKMPESKRTELARQMLMGSRAKKNVNAGVSRPKRKMRKPDGFPTKRKTRPVRPNNRSQAFNKSGSCTDATDSCASTCASPTTSPL